MDCSLTLLMQSSLYGILALLSGLALWHHLPLWHNLSLSPGQEVVPTSVAPSMALLLVALLLLWSGLLLWPFPLPWPLLAQPSSTYRLWDFTASGLMAILSPTKDFAHPPSQSLVSYPMLSNAIKPGGQQPWCRRILEA
ncbi:hypothetical protein BS47DRAFT_1365026 [Hydnum rufescens UP504]|uniref:Uncharacterized protein n=1 Tax=Hydnum rufescens UP504 TaxID=1448309 RepID=A0A9P6AQC7_9AGAM|nr:hypothetical protein BS47DRAFT_1365026 [Hydnum rufescens UP504]